MGEGFFEILDRGDAAGVVGGGGGAAEALPEDAVAGSVGEGVECLGEEGGLELGRGGLEGGGFGGGEGEGGDTFIRSRRRDLGDGHFEEVVGLVRGWEGWRVENGMLKL